MERSDRGVVLDENDIFFVDIGPIYGDFEGDAGDPSYSVTIPIHLTAKHDVRAIWDDRPAKWFADSDHRTWTSTSSPARRRNEHGWVLNLDSSGHRLSDYPHSAHYDERAGPRPVPRPNPNLWVLEIAIAHPDNDKFGAFDENFLLLEDQSFPEGTFPT